MFLLIAAYKSFRCLVSGAILDSAGLKGEIMGQEGCEYSGCLSAMNFLRGESLLLTSSISICMI